MFDDTRAMSHLLHCLLRIIAAAVWLFGGLSGCCMNVVIHQQAWHELVVHMEVNGSERNVVPSDCADHQSINMPCEQIWVVIAAARMLGLPRTGYESRFTSHAGAEAAMGAQGACCMRSPGLPSLYRACRKGSQS